MNDWIKFISFINDISKKRVFVSIQFFKEIH